MPSPEFTRGFKLHLRSGDVLDGAAFPSGRAFVVDDPEYGLASAASSVDELLKGYHRARVEWREDVLLTGPRHTVDTITSDALDALYARIATLTAVAAGNKRHVQIITPELESAQAAIERVRALREPIAEAIEQADYRAPMRRGDLADSVMPVIIAALNGTEQPTEDPHDQPSAP